MAFFRQSMFQVSSEHNSKKFKAEFPESFPQIIPTNEVFPSA